MRAFPILLAILPLLTAEDPNNGRLAAAAAARRGNWRAAESSQRQALQDCAACTPADRAILRAELAGYLTLGGFPEAAIPLWKRSLLELPANSPERALHRLGLGVAYHAAGRLEDANREWAAACAVHENTALETATCRFNIAVARIGTGDVWSEMEQILPAILSANGPIGRATALLQTGRAAIFAGQFDRAAGLLTQADTLIAAELDEQHPFRALVYEARAESAKRQGQSKEARMWRKRATKIPIGKGWDRQTVSVGELQDEPR